MMIKYSIILAIQNECGVEVVQDSGVSFCGRANGDVWLEDSSKGTNDKRKTVKALLELSLQHNCAEALSHQMSSCVTSV